MIAVLEDAAETAEAGQRRPEVLSIGKCGFGFAEQVGEPSFGDQRLGRGQIEGGFEARWGEQVVEPRIDLAKQVILAEVG